MMRSPVLPRQEFSDPRTSPLVPAKAATQCMGTLDSRFARNERWRRARQEGRRFGAHPPDTKPRAASRSCEVLRFSRLTRSVAWLRTQARGGTLFLRLSGKLQRIAFAAASLRAARRFGLRNVTRVDGNHADAAAMRRHHDAICLIFAHAEFALEHGHDELARRVVVVEEDHLMQARPFRLETNFGARLRGDVGHCSSIWWSRGVIFARSPPCVQFAERTRCSSSIR